MGNLMTIYVRACVDEEVFVDEIQEWQMDDSAAVEV